MHHKEGRPICSHGFCHKFIQVMAAQLKNVPGTSSMRSRVRARSHAPGAVAGGLRKPVCRGCAGGDVAYVKDIIRPLPEVAVPD